MKQSTLRIRTLNQLAKDTFARLANDFSQDWIPVSVVWEGDYLPDDDKRLLAGNFLPATGIRRGYCVLRDNEPRQEGIRYLEFPDGKVWKYHHYECSVFGWSYREGIKEGELTKKEKTWDKDFTFVGMLRYLMSRKKEKPCTLQEVLVKLASEMPHLSHFAIYVASEEARHAEFKLYKIPKHVFRFNSQM